MERYLGKAIGSQPPHIFAIADRMYRLLVSQGESQAIIVSGPSGSGKTETCKLVLRHLAFVTRDAKPSKDIASTTKSSMELGSLLVMTNPLLEAFGNAETVLNKNSSRFGKFTQIHVFRQNGQGAILGASIQTYLLESTRVVNQAPNECNYHYFYQLLLGRSAADLAKVHLKPDPNQYQFLRASNGKSTERRGLDKAGFEETMKVMTSIAIPAAMQEAVIQTMAGLLRLGNIELGENPNGDSYVMSSNDLGTTSSLLGANQALLQQALCSRTMKLKTGEMQIPLKPDEARSSRDALAKNLYLKLFGWIVNQVNVSLIDPAVKTSQHNFLGILDIYGFENFERNSLEQLFINFTNEQLHQHFAISLFKTEQEIYLAEGIIWPGVDWEDNTECLEVLAGKSAHSVFNMLTEHSRLPKTNDAEMTEKIHDVHRKSKHIYAAKMGTTGGRSQAKNRLTHREAFVVKHFAGEVVYRTDGWLRKNTDTLHEDLQLCMSSSSSPLLSQLFSVGTINAITGGQRGGSKRAGYVADKYARQLEELMRTLRATQSHFVRCIKPNHEQTGRLFVDHLVLHQLNNSGMVDAVRLLAAGYPTRVPFEQLEKQFKPLAPAKFQNLPPAMFSVALLRAFDLGHSEFLIGLSKAFFKAGKLAFVDEILANTSKLDDKFCAKMGRLLSLWRLRRAVAAVRCLIFLNAKMRRLRALWKFRRSASIASAVGKSWVRRANEIRFGRAIGVLQAYGRGFVARRLRSRRSRGLHVLQRMGRGYLARVYRDKLKIEREAEAKAKAKADRERKYRERKEAAEAAERRRKEQTDAAESARRNKLKASNSVKSGAEVSLPKDMVPAVSEEAKPVTSGDGAVPMKFSRKPLEGDGKEPGPRTEEDGNESEGSDMYQEDSDEEDFTRRPDSQSDLANPRELLAATAALDVRQSRASTGMSIPSLNLGGLDADDDAPLTSSGPKSVRATPSRLSRMKMDVLGSMTPRSSRGGGSSFFASGRKGAVEGRKLFLSKMSKGSLIAAATVRVSKRGDAWQERFVLLVGDVLFVFNLAGQPELPLGLRLWPNQVICLSQSTLSLPNAAVPTVRDGGFQITGRNKGPTLGIAGEDKKALEMLATAMHLGVSNVRRARQQARLLLAQQLCHEKKLSLLKTRHMIELLHKSQEMFFEAGSGQFDDCNAVCMHSGVMRQSLIDVTPFMPVSDFICEYCSCVIIREEQALAAQENAEARIEEHDKQLKKEEQRKLQVDDETLLVARDVRVLRQRRKQANEEAMSQWQLVQEALPERQAKEKLCALLQLRSDLRSMSAAEVENTKASLREQIVHWQQQRDKARAQLEQMFGPSQGGPPPAEKGKDASRGLGRKLSFGKKEKTQQPSTDGLPHAEKAASADSEPAESNIVRKSSFGKSSSITRVLSFGKSNKKKEPSEDPEKKKSGSTAGNLVRKLSFSKKSS